jgi:SAM-dependent methyltransferase
MTTTTLGHYILGMAGLALLRNWHSGSPATDAHFERLIGLADAADEDLLQLPLDTPERDVVAGYTVWAETYDGPNPLVSAEEAVTNPMLEVLDSAGKVALDAGCGTGRKAATLVSLGWEVIGCDLTPAMLDQARHNVPSADLRLGSFEDLPVDDATVDLVVTSLAVCHVADLVPVFSEFSRVLRPGGRVLLSDPHPAMTMLGGQAFFPDGDALAFVRNQGKPVGEYFAAAMAAGLTVDALVEEPMPQAAIEAVPIHGMYPELTEDALEGVPYVLVVGATKSA